MMEEPERILDKTDSALERALLHEGRSYSAPDAVRVHTLTAVGLAASAGIGGGLLAWLSAKSLTTKLALALSSATVVTAIPVTYFLSTRETPVASHNPPAPAAVAIPAPAETVTAPSSETTSPPPPAPSRVASPPSAPAPARASSSSNSALRAELAALDAIRSTLANDDPAGAMSFIAAYFRTFPRGRLRLEAEVLRIDALAKAGRPQAAKRYAQEFLRRHPNSVLTARVRPYAED
jgi:hypothetical protein